MFAKLYGTDSDQVLVKMDDAEKGPEIRIFFEPPGMGICSFALSFEHEDVHTAWGKCEAAFAKIDEKQARAIVTGVVKKMGLPETVSPEQSNG